MRLRTFLLLDLIGSLLWIGLCVGLGYAIGQRAVDVAKAVSRYALYVTLGLVVVIFARQCWVARRAPRRLEHARAASRHGASASAARSPRLRAPARRRGAAAGGRPSARTRRAFRRACAPRSGLSRSASQRAGRRGLQRLDAREQPGPGIVPQCGDRALQVLRLRASRRMVGSYLVRGHAHAALEFDRLTRCARWRFSTRRAEERFDRITRLASALFDVPISTVTMIDEDRQWHKSCVGVSDREDPRAVSFCSVAIEAPTALVVSDAREDPRFADNPLVTGEPFIRFYAGQPIATAEGFRVGTLCVIDRRPRAFGAGEIALLRDLARIAEDELNHGELSHALAAWRGSEQRFRAIFHDAAIGMSLLDRGGRFVETNAAFCEMLGIPADELRGLPLVAVTHPAEREIDRALIDGLFAGERDGFRREKRYVRPDGSVFWGALTASLLRDREGRPDVAIGMVEDITERKEIERIKDELLSVVGHELRTPLTSIRGSLGLLEAGVAGELPAEAREMVGIARANTERLVRLVNETLDLERLEAGRVDVDPRPVTPADLLSATAQIVQPVADAAGVELSWEATELELLADPDRIVQALVNLVANAVKFSPAGTRVHTSIEATGDGEALISVADQGRGIPADQLESIFERFRQVDASDRREKGGTGLGLAISRAIVEQHAGRIWAESEPGQGATFRFTLPLQRSDALVAVYDRRMSRREELARAVRRHGLRGGRVRRRRRRWRRRRRRSPPCSWPAPAGSRSCRRTRRCWRSMTSRTSSSASANCWPPSRRSSGEAAADRRRARHPGDRHDGAGAARRLDGDRRRARPPRPSPPRRPTGQTSSCST